MRRKKSAQEKSFTKRPKTTTIHHTSAFRQPFLLPKRAFCLLAPVLRGLQRPVEIFVPAVRQADVQIFCVGARRPGRKAGSLCRKAECPRFRLSTSFSPFCGGLWWILQKIKKSLDEKKKICSGEKFYKKAENHHNPPHLSFPAAFPAAKAGLLPARAGFARAAASS